MGIILHICTVCKKPRAHTRQVKVQSGSAVRDERICIACLDSADAIISALKRLSPKEKETVAEFVMNKLVGFKSK